MINFFGSNLEYLRMKNKLPLSRVALKFDICEADLIAIENGQEEVSLDIVLYASRLFHVPCGILIGLDLKDHIDYISKASEDIVVYKRTFSNLLEMDTEYIKNRFLDYGDRSPLEEAEDAEAHYVTMYQHFKELCSSSIRIADRLINAKDTMDYFNQDS